MSSLTTKLEEISKRLQQLTVWRPSERDPFIELDRWRKDAHATIEQIFNRKKQQIDHFMEKHEREFMRQVARQRSLLNNIRQRLLHRKESNTRNNNVQNDASILTDLQNVENDVNTRLGRAEILIESHPLNLEDTVIISLKTYLSTTSSMYTKEISSINQPVKPKQRPADEITHALSRWLLVKQEKDSLSSKELQKVKQKKRNDEENRLIRRKQSEDAYATWLSKKHEQMETAKKKSNTHSNGIKTATNET